MELIKIMSKHQDEKLKNHFLKVLNQSTDLFLKIVNLTSQFKQSIFKGFTTPV